MFGWRGVFRGFTCAEHEVAGKLLPFAGRWWLSDFFFLVIRNSVKGV